MNKFELKNNFLQASTRYLSFEPRHNSRQYNKSKSNSKKHTNRNMIPNQALLTLGDKLTKDMENNIKRFDLHNNYQYRKQRTQQSIILSNNTIQNTCIKCMNHHDKKGEYFIQNKSNKRFCLKCNITLNNGNLLSFVNKQKQQKKIILDKFKDQLVINKKQIQTRVQIVIQSIKLSQLKYSQNSNYINKTFINLISILEEKRSELLNNLIISQQNLKIQYQNNIKKLKKISKSIDKYQIDIKKFYQQIIHELPKQQFDHIMQEYEQKLQSNIKKTKKNILIQDGLCIYIPNNQIIKIIEKANIQLYQPFNQQINSSQIFNKSYNIENKRNNVENRRNSLQNNRNSIENIRNSIKNNNNIDNDIHKQIQESIDKKIIQMKKNIGCKKKQKYNSNTINKQNHNTIIKKPYIIQKKVNRNKNYQENKQNNINCQNK